jgi:ribosomal protein S18 acetylase RimI-like enzyme
MHIQTMHIRPFQTQNPDDLESLYEICLKTGDSGQDASSQYRDPKLLGHFYAAPYGVLEPESCFLLEDDLGVCGYIIGTPDSRGFRERLEREWFPILRQKYTAPDGLPDVLDTSRDDIFKDDTFKDATMIRLIHVGYSVEAALLEAYPAHLHIDLLPRAQGQSWGRRLMQTFWQHLRDQQVLGVHLGVGAKNVGGIAFYQKLGFELLRDHSSWQVLGMRL